MNMNKTILKLAIPNIISNISVPLLSLADTAIAGRMTNATSLGAVAMASTLVSFTFWLWGFLRMATTGFTAQAYGAGDSHSQGKQLSVGALIAVLGGLLIILISPLLSHFLGFLGDGAPTLLPEAKAYLRVAYWGAPAALLLYVSFGFVYFGNMGVEGIALGTVVAQYSSVLILLGTAILRYKGVFDSWKWQDLLSLPEFFSYIHIAKYLILRTLMLGSINLFFIKAGSHYGALTVGANTLLMQLFLTFSYFMDGFAYAGEALTGRFYGAKDGSSLRVMLRALFRIGLIIAPLIALVYFFWGENFLSLLSDKPEVVAHALQSQVWVIIIPIVSFMAFLWDGVFVGLTNSKPMMQAVSLAWIVFYLTYFIGANYLGEEALWLAFVSYLATRSLFSLYCGVRLVRTI